MSACVRAVRVCAYACVCVCASVRACMSIVSVYAHSHAQEKQTNVSGIPIRLARGMGQIPRTPRQLLNERFFAAFSVASRHDVVVVGSDGVCEGAGMRP